MAVNIEVNGQIIWSKGLVCIIGVMVDFILVNIKQTSEMDMECLYFKEKKSILVTGRKEKLMVWEYIF